MGQPVDQIRPRRLPNHLKELASQLCGSQITAVSVHPGIVETSQPVWLRTGILGALFRAFVVDKTVSQGAATTLYACLDPSLSEQSTRGAYLSDCSVAQPSTSEARDASGENGEALWAATEEELSSACKCE